jgi:formate hydrogenlyase subunit 5
MTLATFAERANQRWRDRTLVHVNAEHGVCELTCEASAVVQMCDWLANTLSYQFAGLVVEEQRSQWELRYLFSDERDAGWVHVVVHQPLPETTFPSVAGPIFAIDRHEREAEDLFGLVFAGHPKLGDFVLHDDRWQEGLAPMRHGFDGLKPVADREPNLNWRPRRIVEEPGAFVMPIGPIYGGVTESVHFLLETVGEDAIRAIPRLFYQYRGIEKMAEGRSVDDGLLLAERFAARTAFAHAWAYCRAAETIAQADVPPRAQMLRVLLAELERLRHHVEAIQEICESTALAVASNQAAILEEELLRLSGAFTGHRYLFGLTTLGGLTRDFDDRACRDVVDRAQHIARRLGELEDMLSNSSSFLDRIEDVGIVATAEAIRLGLVGPVARASNISRDLRKGQPYCAYGALSFDVPSEREGDGYARLRVLFAEARQSVRLIEQAASALPDGPVRVPELRRADGAALGWTEAPRGPTFHWLRVEGSRIARYHAVTPSFANWHGFHAAAENIAFQDFPIILATFDLSVAENDR